MKTLAELVFAICTLLAAVAAEPPKPSSGQKGPAASNCARIPEEPGKRFVYKQSGGAPQELDHR